jgi:hypothetical protein
MPECKHAPIYQNQQWLNVILSSDVLFSALPFKHRPGMTILLHAGIGKSSFVNLKD